MNRILLLCLLFLPLTLDAAQLVVHDARVSSQPDLTRIVLDTSQSVSHHKVFSLSNPARLVIDLTDAQLKANLPVPSTSDHFLQRIRAGVREGKDLRIVLDLKQSVRAKSFRLQPDGRFGHRLVIDLFPRTDEPVATKSLPNARTAPTVTARRDAIIAIDAGHGGKDPGAIGAGGLQEKEVTLAIARKLATRINRQPGLRAVLVRDGDYFIPLHERIQIARRHRADLFLSIHADAFHDPKVRGSSVFTLSERGATSEAAKWLAARENKADVIGGIDFSRNREVAGVLMEMSQNLTMEQSGVAAQKVLNKLGQVNHLHQSRVQSAGFAVLRAPDIPSMLIEVAFLTNPEEEERLRDRQFRERIADSLVIAVKRYFEDYPPPRVMLAEADASAGEPRRYVIERGDTLLDIARNYQVSLSALRQANQLQDDRIRVGQVLRIPES